VKNSQPQAFNIDGSLYVPAPLSSTLYKSLRHLEVVIDNLVLRYGVTKILFITLTFPSVIHSVKESHRRLNSLLNDVRHRYSSYVWVLEPHHSGAIHYHLLVPVEFNTNIGVDLGLWQNYKEHTDLQRRTSMSPLLRVEADWWANRAPRSGFGRVDVAPIYSTGEAIRVYLLKQGWRKWHWPFKELKSIRFWSCSRNIKSGSVKFSWNTEGGKRYRDELKKWAADYGCYCYDDLRRIIGKKWPQKFYVYYQGLPTPQMG
jgi:hypothetical protein